MDEEKNKSLEDLVEQLAKGDISALSEISNKIEGTLKAIANSYYQNKADVEDAVQNLYVKLYEKAGKFKRKANASARAWIITIFRNSIKNHLIRRDKETALLQLQFIYDKSRDNASEEFYAWKYVEVRDIFDSLSVEEQRIIFYYYWGECSIREIAAILYKPKSTIHKKLVKIQEKVIKLKKF